MSKKIEMITYVEYEYELKSNGNKIRNQSTEFEGSKTKTEVLEILKSSHADNAVEGSLVLTKLHYTKGI